LQENKENYPLWKQIFAQKSVPIMFNSGVKYNQGTDV
jgi:hypothetical protein